MVNPQLRPLEVNDRTGEPFLRLRNHDRIIITPPRPTDVTAYPPLLNDRRIYEWLIGPPIPYLLEHSQAWYDRVKKPCDDALTEIEAVRETKDPIIVRHCPIRAIREVKEDGEDVYLGDIGLTRCTDEKILPPGLQVTDQQRAEYVNINSDGIVTDPNIVWTIGDYLSPSHHGQGIMTDAVETLLWDWAIPRMGVCRVVASASEGNHGSVRVFQKNGFVLTRTLENYVVWTGRMRNLHILEWNITSVEPRYR